MVKGWRALNIVSSSGLGFVIWSLGCGVEVWGVGYGIKGLRVRVWG